ncbi:MFS transporter [Saccharolobus caldissimus]|uniref:MFS transporter n=1 Tax=Saccharolobus caldissimus TaxID=1702097 RepID=A0AAQ4CV70_9CREN|nr:MFS transporter [Saccharolobus caldissimus]BDB99701.1 MFS transporter [Saccharolobus caldissimus]
MSYERSVDTYIARVDRLPAWGLSYSLIAALAFSFFITIYDAAGAQGIILPYIPYVTNLTEASIYVSLALAGYIPGAILIGYLADKFGRRPMLITTVAILAISGIGIALTINLPMLYVFRFLLGVGIGADIDLTMTYLSEMSPSIKRGLYVNWAFFGGWLGSGIGAIIAASLVAINPVIGWRLVYGITGVLALVALVLRAHAPESVRFLAKKGKFDEAEKLLERMEKLSMKRAKVNSLPQPKTMSYVLSDINPWKMLAHKTYLKRLVVLLLLWITIYIATYTYLGLYPTFLHSVLGYSGSLLNTANFLFAYAGLAAPIAALATRLVIERFDKRKIIAIAAVGWSLGIILATLAASSKNFPIMLIGFVIWVISNSFTYQASYLVTAESFPNAARATGFALTDGLGHLGGVIGPLIIFPLILMTGPIWGWELIHFEMIVLGIIVLLTIPFTTKRRLEEFNEASIQDKT